MAKTSGKSGGARHLVTAIAVGVVTAGAGLELNGLFLETAIAGLVWFAMALAGGAFLSLGIVKQKRGPFVRGAAIVAGLVVGVVISGTAGATQVRVSKERGDLIAASLSAYREAHGSYPATLQELVPTCLSDIPSTAMGLLRTQSFEYGSWIGGYRLSFLGRVGTGFWRGPDVPWTWFD